MAHPSFNWKIGLLCVVGLVLVVLGFVLPLIDYMYPRHVEEKRLANNLNQELNEFLKKNEGQLGWAHSYWGAAENSATFHVYGAAQEAQQAAVLSWLADVKAERNLRVEMEINFYEDYRPVGVALAKHIKTVSLSNAGGG